MPTGLTTPKRHRPKNLWQHYEWHAEGSHTTRDDDEPEEMTAFLVVVDGDDGDVAEQGDGQPVLAGGV